MSLSIGLRLGPYEIQAPVGAGGMGEVYKAVDVRLKRTVAIKVLPQEVTASPEARQRLEREARSISRLTHPHICTLYDFGEQDSVEFLVMEYLEGETLERRLQRGALPIPQVLTYGIQIASALDKAHQLGIIHRDLKPANIMLTKDGAKLLDFGLAKIRPTHDSIVGETLTDLPADKKNLTGNGVILGTFQYMAPEQLEGKEADERTDVFALGEVIYEMATGKPPFAGKSRASLIAAILASEPVPITTLNTITPPALNRVVNACLVKDPHERWQRAHDLKMELGWIAESSFREPDAAPRMRIRWERLAWATLVLAIAAALVAAAYFHRSAAPTSVVRFSIQAPEGSTLDDLHTVAMSPDGQRLVLLARGADKTSSLWLRSLDSISAIQLPGTEGSDTPVWSPDSRWLLFVADDKIRKIDTHGGLPDVLCDVKGMAVLGWNGQNTALLSFSFKGSAAVMPIQQLGLDDCVMKPAIALDRSRYNMGLQWSRFLPDGRHFLYSGLRNNRKHDVLLAKLGSDETQSLIANASDAKYVPPGYLLFERNGFLFAQPFSISKLSLYGEPVQILPDQLAFGSYSGSANYDVSESGVLVYQLNPVILSKLVWRDFKGTPLSTMSTGSWLGSMRVASDGKRLLVSKHDPKTHTSDLWMLDLQKNDWRRLTFDASTGSHIGVLSPDGRQAIYAAVEGAAFQLHRKVIGSGESELLGKSNLDQVPSDWSPDGRFLLFTQTDTNGAGDVWVLPMDGKGHAYALTQTRFDEHDAHFSPDGRWIAYSSDESGRPEVYVASFGEPEGRLQVSSAGGQTPRWNQQGDRLYYIAEDGKLMEVRLKTGSKVNVATPRSLFQVRKDSDYAVMPDEKFMIMENTANLNSMVAALNWDASANLKH